MRSHQALRRIERATRDTIGPVASVSPPLIPAPKAVLFDLFHTLASVPPPGLVGEEPVPRILGVPTAEWQRRYYDDDVLGRCLGHIVDSVEIMRSVTHSIDPTVPIDRILAAVDSRRRRFETGLTAIEPPILEALEKLRAMGIRTALVSNAGADDVESWPRSPLCGRLDAVVFSYQVGVRKPGARIYERALETIDVRAGDAIFVGDGGSDEHRGARALGMQTVLVTRLAARWGLDRAASGDVDWAFEDVSRFVDALVMAAPSGSSKV
jgi:putative hydrolase of the HAD superfamily